MLKRLLEIFHWFKHDYVATTQRNTKCIFQWVYFQKVAYDIFLKYKSVKAVDQSLTLYNLNLRVLELMSKYTEIITTLLLCNCWVFMWFQGLLPGKQTVLRVSDSSSSLPTHEEWIAICWPNYIFGQGIIIESYWPWITFSYPALRVLILGNMSIQGCMLTDTMHLGIIQISQVMKIVRIKISWKSQYGCCKKMEKTGEGFNFNYLCETRADING